MDQQLVLLILILVFIVVGAAVLLRKSGKLYIKLFGAEAGLRTEPISDDRADSPAAIRLSRSTLNVSGLQTEGHERVVKADESEVEGSDWRLRK